MPAACLPHRRWGRLGGRCGLLVRADGCRRVGEVELGYLDRAAVVRARRCLRVGRFAVRGGRIGVQERCGASRALGLYVPALRRTEPGDGFGETGELVEHREDRASVLPFFAGVVGQEPGRFPESRTGLGR